MIEWHYEVVAAPVPEPTGDQLEDMQLIIKGVISYDADKQEMRFVFRRTEPSGLLTLLTEGYTAVGTALQAVIPEIGYTAPLCDYVRDFRMMRAEDVPVPEDVRRFAESLGGEKP